MPPTTKLSVSLPTILVNQVQALAQQLGITPDALVAQALEQFIQQHTDVPAPASTQAAGQRVIHQGDVYWVQLETPDAAEPAIPHPYVVIQEDIFNHSRIPTVIACALTSNIKRASLPGTVLLDVGEANLPRPSVVEASKVTVLDKQQLGAFIGALSEQRIHQIRAALRFLQASFIPGNERR